MVLKVTLLFLVGLKFMQGQILEAINKEFPDINEMLSFTRPLNTKVLSKPSKAIAKNISIDLEKLNMESFKLKLDMFKAKLANSRGDIGNWSDDSVETRRMKYYGNIFEWNNAHVHIVKTKCLDMMLQLIYMARHKIRQLESMPYFNRHDTSYRIAFLYRRLRRIWKKMMDIITTMKKRKSRARYFAWIEPYLVLHHKAAALHVDFVYMWWVMMNLHNKYNLRHYIPNTTPMDKPKS